MEGNYPKEKALPKGGGSKNFFVCNPALRYAIRAKDFVISNGSPQEISKILQWVDTDMQISMNDLHTFSRFWEINSKDGS